MIVSLCSLMILPAFFHDSCVLNISIRDGKSIDRELLCSSDTRFRLFDTDENIPKSLEASAYRKLASIIADRHRDLSLSHASFDGTIVKLLRCVAIVVCGHGCTLMTMF